MRAFQGVFVDPERGDVFEGCLSLESGRIVEVSKRPPKRTETIKLEGFITPGMIDAHVHLCLDGGADPVGFAAREHQNILMARAVGFLGDHLRAGVTTLRDMGGPGGLAIHLREAVNRGFLVGPRIWACGHNLTITGGHGWQFGREADGEDGVRAAARAELKAGADGLKFMATGGVITRGVISGAPAFTVAEMRAGVEEAHKVGKRTAAHAQSLEGVRNALEAGVDTIEHGAFDQWDAATLEFMRTHQRILVATLAPREVVLGPKARGREVLPAWLIEKAERATANHSRNVLEAYRAGLTVAAGTDAGVPLLPHGTVALELRLMASLGVTLEDVLRAGTIHAAAALGWADVGSFRPGSHADLVVLETNPLEDAGAYGRVRQVFKAGEAVST